MTMTKDIRTKLFIDEHRMRNMDKTYVARRCRTMSYLEDNLRVVNMLNIARASQNLEVLSPVEKNRCLRNYSSRAHVSKAELEIFAVSLINQVLSYFIR